MKKLYCLLLCLLPVLSVAHDDQATLKVVPLLKTQTTWDGAAIVYPQLPAEVTALWIEVAPGAETGWHFHEVPSFAYMVEGGLVVTTRTGLVKHLNAGEAMAEVVGTIHNGRNVGEVPAKLVVFYAGKPGVALSRKAP